MTKLSWLNAFTAATLTSQAVIIPAHEQSSYLSIPVQAKLESSAVVQKVQSLISSGDQVKVGDLLVQIESKRLQDARVTSLEAENNFYRNQLNSNNINSSIPANINIQPEVLSLIKSRTAMVAENKLFRLELNDNTENSLTEVKKQILQTASLIENRKKENRSRRLNLTAQINDITTIIKNNRDETSLELANIDKQITQNPAKIIAARRALAINISIFNDIKPAFEQGAISKIQVANQERVVEEKSLELNQLIQEKRSLPIERKRLLNDYQDMAKSQQQTIQRYRSNIAQLDEEFVRLQLTARGEAAKLNLSIVSRRNDIYTRIVDNDLKIAKIDSQINRKIIENEKKIAEIHRQTQQSKFHGI